MENVTKKDLMDIAENTGNPLIKQRAKQKMQEEFEGDVVAQKMIQLSQLLANRNQGMNLDEKELKRIIREELETEKIKFENLDNISEILNLTVDDYISYKISKTVVNNHKKHFRENMIKKIID